MSKIVTADVTLSADEQCFGMQVWEAADGFCTRLIVLQNDLPVGIVIHHGPSEEYSGKIPPLLVADESSVGAMMAESERHRRDLKWFKRAEEMRASSTLIADVIRQDEEARLAIKNRSIFGPHQTTQRNGHNHVQVQRDWWAERARRTGRTSHYRIQGVRP